MNEDEWKRRQATALFAVALAALFIMVGIPLGILLGSDYFVAACAVCSSPFFVVGALYTGLLISGEASK